MSNDKPAKKYQNITPVIETMEFANLTAKTGNLYEALNIVSKRANQLSLQTKEELHAKLEDYASLTDNLEEVTENKEQIEISKFYERLPSATLRALAEFLNDEVYYRKPEEEEIAPAKGSDNQ